VSGLRRPQQNRLFLNVAAGSQRRGAFFVCAVARDHHKQGHEPALTTEAHASVVARAAWSGSGCPRQSRKKTACAVFAREERDYRRRLKQSRKDIKNLCVSGLRRHPPKAASSQRRCAFAIGVWIASPAAIQKKTACAVFARERDTSDCGNQKANSKNRVPECGCSSYRIFPQNKATASTRQRVPFCRRRLVPYPASPTPLLKRTSVRR